jgi:hypothetical protein
MFKNWLKKLFILYIHNDYLIIKYCEIIFKYLILQFINSMYSLNKIYNFFVDYFAEINYPKN